MIELAPKTLLIHADLLLTDPPAAIRGRWPNAVAVLLRQALERSIDQLWDSKEHGLIDASMRSQLLLLPRYINKEIAQDAAITWYELSAACHQRAYSLPPTAGELGRWYERTDALVREVARITTKAAHATRGDPD